jgi:endonuclease/exonuclease/phosphatase family metal-dependent hydrolase
VGILTRKGYHLVGIRSHVEDGTPTSRTFSRDCPEYTVRTPSGERIVVLVNHFKSKGFGVQAANNARRKAQAEAVAKIYRRLRRAGERNVAVMGDMNDTPDSDPMKPLVQDTDLRDIFEHPTFFDPDNRPGTFGTGSKGNKIDYILLSPALFNKVTSASVFRKGVWAGKNGTIFPHYDSMTEPVHQGSDHAALFADIAI